MGMALELIVGSYKKTCDFVGPQENIEKIRRTIMCLKFVRPDPTKLDGNPSYNYFPPLPPTRIP